MFQTATEQSVTTTWTNIGIDRVKNASAVKKRKIARKHNRRTHSLPIFIFLHYKFRGFFISHHSPLQCKSVQMVIGLKFPRNDLPVQNDPSRAQNLQTRCQDRRLVQRPWQNFHCRPTCSTFGRTPTQVRNNWRKSEPLRAPTKIHLPNILLVQQDTFFPFTLKTKCINRNLLSSEL